MSEIVVLRGPSQFGKTTFLNDLIVEGPVCKVGDGSGESCARATVTRLTRIGQTIDGAGDNDSGLARTNEEAGEMYCREVLKGNGASLKVILFESLAESRRELRQSLASLRSTFGPEIVKATIVVACKSDMVQREAKKAILRTITETMTNNGMNPNLLVEWQQFAGLNPQEQEEQLNSLLKTLSRVKAVTPGQLQSLMQRVKARAELLCQQQVGRTASTQISENYVIEGTKKVRDKKVEEYEIEVPVEVTKKKEKDSGLTAVMGALFGGVGLVAGGLMGGPVGAMAGGAAASSASASIAHGLQGDKEKITEYRKIKSQRVVDGPEREEKTYTPGTRARQVNVGYTLAPADFMEEARLQILAEDRKVFAHSLS